MNNIEALKGLLKCYICGSEEFLFNKDTINCSYCKTCFRIIDDIPFLLPKISREVRKVQETFEFKWALQDNFKITQNSYVLDDKGQKSIIPVKLKTVDDNWIELTKREFNISETDVNGKTVLDIGAGFGRMAYVMGSMGAKHIFSFDVCRSGMKKALVELSDWKNITFIQADISKMPFKSKSFDIVISWGVFHHMPNTEIAFRSGAKLVKYGGLLLVHLYETHSKIRIKHTNILRRFIQLFPLRVQYWLCKHLLVIRDWKIFSRQDWIGKVMLFLHKRIAFGNNPVGTFDCYSPRFNHTHTDEEIIEWYKTEGFEEIKVVNKELYDPNFSPEDNELLQKENGKHGGFLLLKGRKRLNN